MTKKVVQLSDVRAQKTDQERRKIERYFLKDVFQMFCVLNEKLSPIELIEAGEGGFSFRVPFHPEQKILTVEQELAIRVYLSRDTFLPLGIKIMSAIALAEEGQKYMRYGCSLDSAFSSYPAYQQLMKFIEAYSITCRKDKEKSSAGGFSGR